MQNWFWHNKWALLLLVAAGLGTGWAVHHARRPGQLDVLTAQGMDMSGMRPPAGAAPVALDTARRGALNQTVTYTGSVQAYNEQEIAARVAGRVVSLPVYPGEPVRAGETVAQLDTAELSARAAQDVAAADKAAQQTAVARLSVLQARAAVQEADSKTGPARQAVADSQAQADAAQEAIPEAQAGVTSAQTDAYYWRDLLSHDKHLLEAGAISLEEYQREAVQAQAAFAALSQAQARVRQAQDTARAARARVAVAQQEVLAAQAGRVTAEAALAVARGQVAQAGAEAAGARAQARVSEVVRGYTKIAAPASGVVTARPVAPGTLVQPGTVLLKIAEIDRVRLQANVAATDLEGLGVGSPAQVLPAGGPPISARVSSVFPSANAQTRTTVVECVVPNPGHRLLPGAFVTMRLSRRDSRSGVLVPAVAIVSEGGGSFVWTVVGEAAAAHRRAVTTLGSDGALTAIAPGAIQPGERVVTHGQAGLTEGVRVVETPWGPDGPRKLPTAASASRGVVRYECATCHMTFSAEDARAHGYRDPMDGGRLVPVRQ